VDWIGLFNVSVVLKHAVERVCYCFRTGTISPGDYLLAIGDVWLDNHSLEEAAHVLTAADKVVKLRIQKNECYAGNYRRQGGDVFMGISLFVYQQDYAKTTPLIFTKFGGRRHMSHGRNH